MPEQPVIVDTSPLLYLHLADHLWILQRLYNVVLIPPAVQSELAAGFARGAAVPDIEREIWIVMRPVSAPSLMPAITDLGRGEAEVIALGLETPGALLILDDGLARRIAAANGLNYTGTLGVLIRAKRAGLLFSFIEVAARLRAQGMWLSEEVLRTAAELAGERIE